jgi:hypothetical protein
MYNRPSSSPKLSKYAQGVLQKIQLRDVYRNQKLTSMLPAMTRLRKSRNSDGGQGTLANTDTATVKEASNRRTLQIEKLL